MSSNYSMSSTAESSKSGKSMNFLGDLTKPLTSSIMQVKLYEILNYNWVLKHSFFICERKHYLYINLACLFVCLSVCIQ